MKVLIIPVPNVVPTEEILAAMQNFFNEIGVATKLTIVEEPDAEPLNTMAKTKIMLAVDKCISMCGCGDEELAFKAKFRNMVVNNGDINFELLEVLTSRKTRKEIQYLKDHHLEWLPNYADRLYKSLAVIYGKDV